MTCATDGTPATSARCANQLAGKHVAAMLGATDTGGGGSFPVFGRKKLRSSAASRSRRSRATRKNGVMFCPSSVADNAAATTYAAQHAAREDDRRSCRPTTRQGNYTGSIIANVAKNVGMKVKSVEVPVRERPVVVGRLGDRAGTPT